MGTLPDGVFVHSAGADCLIWNGELRPWTADGYASPVAAAGAVEVLTPRPTVAAIRAGYIPGVHASA